MSIASDERQLQAPEHRRFGMAFPHIPIPMVFLMAAIVVALLIASRNGRSPGPAANLDSPHPFLTQVKVSIDPLTHWQPRSGQIRITLESTGKRTLPTPTSPSSSTGGRHLMLVNGCGHQISMSWIYRMPKS